MGLIDPQVKQAADIFGERQLLECAPAWARGLGRDDQEALCSLFSEPEEHLAKTELKSQTCCDDRLHILLEGWVSRFVRTPDGRHQIMSIGLPGDLLDVECLYHAKAHYGLAAISDCRVVVLSRSQLGALIRERPEIGFAIGSALSQDNFRLGEDAARLGRRTAREKMAHFFCESVSRLAEISSPSWRGYHFPVIQEQLASILGLSVVHVNRTLQDLRADNLVELRAQRIRIPDWDALARVAQFDRDMIRAETAPIEVHRANKTQKADPANMQRKEIRSDLKIASFGEA